MRAAMDRFPVLWRKAKAQASTLSGGEQKMLEIARGLMLEPKLMLIDEPSIGLSPRLVQETFAILHELRAKGMSILMVEQNAKRALEISDFGVVLELGRTRMEGAANLRIDFAAHGLRGRCPDFSEATRAFLEMCWLRVRCSAPRHPICDPADQLFGVYARTPKEREGFLRVTEQRIL